MATRKLDLGMTQEALNQAKTDAHLDTNEVRAGAVLICPMKIDGGGVYIGDCHANQGDGELFLHTTDIALSTALHADDRLVFLTPVAGSTA